MPIVNEQVTIRLERGNMHKECELLVGSTLKGLKILISVEIISIFIQFLT